MSDIVEKVRELSEVKEQIAKLNERKKQLEAFFLERGGEGSAYARYPCLWALFRALLPQ